MATKTFLNMRIAPRVMCLLVIAVVVYGLVYMSFIRQERNNDNRLQRPEDLEVLRRLKRIEVLVYKIGEFLLITYIWEHIISSLSQHLHVFIFSQSNRGQKSKSQKGCCGTENYKKVVSKISSLQFMGSWTHRRGTDGSREEVSGVWIQCVPQ